MHIGRFPATLLTAALFAGVCAVMPARADGVVTPTISEWTPEDVGVLDRPRPEYDSKGIPLGGFRLFPTLDLAASYDDNVFRLDTPQSDYYFTISPTLRLQSQWGRHSLEPIADRTPMSIRSSAAKPTDWKVAPDGRLDTRAPAMFSANVYYGEFHELWSAPNNLLYQSLGQPLLPDPRRRRDRLSAEPARHRLRGSYDHYAWLNTPQIGGGTLYNTDRNMDEYQSTRNSSTISRRAILASCD